jgi:integrase
MLSNVYNAIKNIMMGNMMGKKQGFEQDEKKKHPINALTAVQVRSVSEPGLYADGACLYLQVSEGGAKSWILRTLVHGKRRDIGLGGVNWVSLADARDEAARLRKIAKAGGDPIAERQKERAITPLFETVAREVHASHSQAFQNPKHAAQWITTLETYAFPTMGNIPIDKIESKEILAALSPIWIEKAETARRVKQRLKTVFDYAKAKGWRSGDNPVEGITRVLPKHGGKVKDHFSALPYVQVPEFIQSLRSANNAMSIRLGFEFLILTASRTSEVILAKWPEIDLDAETWIVPAERMKMKREHRVPLSARCIEILQAAKEAGRGSEYIFPGRSANRPLSNMALLKCLERMGRADTTAHGFRSSFRDWAEEKTNTQRSVVEAALAHQVESKVEAAYLRSDLFEKRRRLMDAWAAFALAKPAEKVVKIRA